MPIKAVQQLMLGKISKNEIQIRETLKSIKSFGYDGIELNSFMIHPTPLFVRMLTKAAGMPSGNGGKYDWHSIINDSNLKVTSLHTDLGSLERDYIGVCEEAKSFNTDTVVITGMYRFDYSDDLEIKNLCKRLNDCGEKMKEYGISLLYHNHNCELINLNENQKAYDVLIEETNPDYVNFEFDSYWFAEAGCDYKYYMKKLSKRMKMFHINDRGTRIKGKVMTPIINSDSVELGYGNMPLDDLIDIAQENETKAIILEMHKNHIDNSPLKSIELSSKYLNGRIK